MLATIAVIGTVVGKFDFDRDCESRNLIVGAVNVVIFGLLLVHPLTDMCVFCL